MERCAWVALVAMGFGLCGCKAFEQARPFDGSLDKTSMHDIRLSVTPAMARCDALRQGVVIGSYDPARRVVTVPVGQASIDIFCSADGFKDKRVNIVPDNAARGNWAFVLQDFGPYSPSYPFSLTIEMEPSDNLGQPV